MILLQVFFDFEVEVLEVLEGFEAWFLQSFFTSESWSLSNPSSTFLQPSSNALGRLLFTGVWGWVSNTWQSLIGDTCHNLIGPLMSSLTCARIACVVAYMCEAACVIAYTSEAACDIVYTREATCVIAYTCTDA